MDIVLLFVVSFFGRVISQSRETLRGLLHYRVQSGLFETSVITPSRFHLGIVCDESFSKTLFRGIYI